MQRTRHLSLVPRQILRLGIIVALLATLTSPATAADGDGAEVLEQPVACDMAWYPTDFDDDPAPILWGDCWGHNVMTPNGDYHLVLTGTLPTEALDEFAADGSPKSYATGCLVNYLFMIEAGFPAGEFVFTDSVRRYSMEGDFKEVCHFKATS